MGYGSSNYYGHCTGQWRNFFIRISEKFQCVGFQDYVMRFITFIRPNQLVCLRLSLLECCISYFGYFESQSRYYEIKLTSLFN
ncbi:hypothetical protein G4B88_008099 [Cannabis sativa]|uniref:Uncharacterized protein n=1 Tax=Cannabis sativa TaxID=3483 RepID=A0A7J6I7B1_CANSA|nr:hypothetical protein G4B88_008099 [Cannabis sativa]